MDDAPLTVVELKPRRERGCWSVFVSSDRFVKPWWQCEDRINGDEHWLSFELRGIEVARCKLTLDVDSCSHPQFGDMPDGQLDILALEVAVQEQRRGIGRRVLLAIREMYPLPRLTALNDDSTSRGFWDRVGWVRHESRLRFLAEGVERVNYSER
jgi:ribosomal protein S18 acetylase RimI-like enzyme